MHWNLIDAVMKCFARFAPIITSRLEISPRIEQLNAERERLRVPLCWRARCMGAVRRVCVCVMS